MDKNLTLGKNIVVLTTEPFPIGMAAANRILSYSKGLIESKNKVKVYCIRPANRGEIIYNVQVQGVYNSVEYIYTANSTEWPNNIIRKIYVFCKGVFLAIPALIKDKKYQKIDFIISTYDVLYFNIIFFLLSKLIKAKYFQMLDEYPYFLRYPSNSKRIQQLLHYKLNYKLCDGMMVMTNALVDFYKDKVRKKVRITRIPMSVEFERFNEIVLYNKIEKNDFLTYCGNEAKVDGIDIIITAFWKIHNRFPHIYLRIIGDLGDETNILKQKAKQLNIQEKIIFTGRISRDEVPNYLKSSRLLLLARKKSKIAEGAFPTKLGEYLSSGIPVLVTDVGEISNYLKDKVNAFICKPDDVDSFAAKIIEALSNPELSTRVGLEGKKLAQREFHYKSISNRMIEFMNNA